jgi:flagellar protein FliO/FliZ
MKKMGALSPINSRDKMKVVAGLSLGGREKIVLVQVGEKQLLLGVSPGKIDNLLVLEGDDCIYQEKNNGMSEAENDFSHKLKQIMKGSLNE